MLQSVKRNIVLPLVKVSPFAKSHANIKISRSLVSIVTSWIERFVCIHHKRFPISHNVWMMERGHQTSLDCTMIRKQNFYHSNTSCKAMACSRSDDERISILLRTYWRKLMLGWTMITIYNIYKIMIQSQWNYFFFVRSATHKRYFTIGSFSNILTIESLKLLAD